MKKTLNQKLRSIIMLALFLTATVSIGQVQYTVARGHSGFVTASDATGVSTSVTNILTNCSTSSPSNSTSSMTMTAQNGFSFYVTSVTGNRYRSSAGWSSAYLNFVNANTGTNQSNGTTSIGSSGTCGTAYSVGTFSYAASAQTVPSGQSATVSVVPSGSGSGYSGTKSITAIVTVTGIGTITNSSNAAITSLSFPSTNVTATSVASSFVLQPSAISGSNILVQAPTNWLVCETSNGTYTSSISFANNTSVKTIYVKFAPTTAGSLSGQIVVSKETNGSGVANRTLNVSGTGIAVTPPAITSSLTDTSIYGSTDTYQITATNTPNGYNATYNGGALPTGMSIVTSTGIISISESLAAGTYEISISASNSGGGQGDPETLVYTRTAKPLTLTGGEGNDKIYDGTTDATIAVTPMLSGTLSSDVVSVTGTPVAEFFSADAGTQQIRIVDGYNVDNSNYTLVFPQEPEGLTADILQRELTITGIFVNDKNFDGNTTATIGGTPSLTGVIDGDLVTINYSAVVATFLSAASGTNIPVSVSGYVLEGTDSGDYTLLQPTDLSGNINDTGLEYQTITFDELNSVIYGDAPFDLTASSTSGLEITYSSSDENIAVVSGNSVTIISAGTVIITASQSGDDQYNPAQAVQQQLVINPKILTITDAAVVTKTYDGTTVAQVTGTLTGIVGTDDVATSGTGIFENKSAGENKVVTTLFTITGTDVENYTLQQPGDITGNITPLQLTLTDASAQDKVYDGTNVAVITGTLSGIIAPDMVSFVGSGAFEDTNVAQNIAIDANLVLTGDDSGNYTIEQPTGLEANITQAGITVEASVSDKIYNLTTDAEIVVTSVNGIVDGDDITVTGGGTFYDFNVGTAIPVTSNLLLSGSAAINYVLTQPTGLAASITKKDITANIASAIVTDKVYDNTTTAAVSGVILNDVISGDEANLEILSAAFVQETVGSGIEVSEFVLSGTAAGNYNLIQPISSLTGNITPATLTLTSAIAQNKVYDGTDAATITGILNGIVSGDTVTYSGVGAFETLNVANNINVIASVILSGSDADNYIVEQPIGLSADITPREVIIAAEAVSKVYDGTTATSVQNAYVDTGVISPDDVTLVETTVTGTFNNATVANGKPVSAVFTLAGANADNYIIAVQTYPADITPATLTVDVTDAAVATKTYDGTDAAQVSGAVLSGFLEGDTVNAVSGTFDSANSGTEKPVTIVLTGADALNYIVIQPEPLLTGIINKKDITATADNISKVQGTANPILTITYNGLVNEETAETAFNFVAPVTTTTAVTNSPIGVYPISIQGGSAANYNFTTLTSGLLSVMASTAITNILAWDFTGEAASPTSTAEVQDSNLDSSLILSRGAGAGASPGANSFRTTGFQNNGIALSNTDYFQFEVSADSNYVVSLSSIDALFRGTPSFGATVTHRYAYSTNGTSFTFIGDPIVTTSGEYATISLDVSEIAALQNVAAGTTITFRYYASGSTPSGGWGYYSSSTGNYGLAVKGIVSVAPVLPTITSLLVASSSIGDTDTYQITANGTPQIDFEATSLPEGASIDNNGLITFDGTTPAGTYNIMLSASSFYGSDSKTLVYTVDKLDQVLTFDPDPLPAVTVGDVPFLFEVNNTALLPVSWSSSDESVVTIDTDGLITIIGEGTAVITASNSGNDIYNPVVETRNIVVSLGCFEWTGATSTAWTTGSNWCGGNVPTSSDDVTIPDTANDPVITSGIAYAHNLTLGAGATLTVNTGATLSVDNILSVNPTATLTVQNNAALLQGAATTTDSNSGKITFHKTSNPLFRLDYTLWSSPVDNWSLYNFSPATATTRYYEYKYDYTGTEYANLYWPISSATTFTAAKGYLIRMPNVLTANVTGTTNDGVTTPTEYSNGTDNYYFDGTFTGEPHNGTITYPLSVEGNKYTAIGNPYPSPINLSDFFSANSSIINTSSGIYLWRKRNNSANSSYATLSQAGYAANPQDGGVVDMSSYFSGSNIYTSWTIAPAQGFFVKTADAVSSASITFTNAMRRATPGASQAFFKSAQSTASRLWLNIVAENGSANQAMVAYMEEGTMDLDYGFDAKKFTDGSTLTIYSVAQQTPLAIQARPVFEASDVVPMGFTAPAAGTFTITLDHVDGLFEQGQKIYLRDNQEGIIRDLTQMDYAFSTEAGTFEGRFDVIYTTTALGTDNPVLKANQVMVYTEGSVIGINSGDAMMNNVTIFDIRGRKLYSQNGTNNTTLKISNLTAEQQVLIIEVDTVNGKVSKRIIY